MKILSQDLYVDGIIELYILLGMDMITSKGHFRISLKKDMHSNTKLNKILEYPDLFYEIVMSLCIYIL